MASKPKIIKKVHDPHGGLIALGGAARAKDSSGSADSAAKDSTSLKSSASAGGSLSTLGQQQSANESGNSKAKLAQPSSSSNLTAATATASANANILDPKTIKDEINKLIDKDDAATTEKLTKMVRALIFNLKPASAAVATSPGMPTKQQQQLLLAQQQQQVQQQQQPDLNYLMALSYLALKRPQLFLKQPQIVEMVCTNLLYSSKSSDKLSGGLSALKAKSLQPIRQPNSLGSAASIIPPTICNILFVMYENEASWPDIFLKAFIDDSLNDRVWVDSSQCKEFVQNILSVFNTKPIPLSVDKELPAQSTTSSNVINMLSETSTGETMMDYIVGGESSLDSTNSNMRKTLPRYSHIQQEVHALAIETIRNYIANSSKQQLSHSRLGASSLIGPQAVNVTDNRNFLKLAQAFCGLSEVRSMVVPKLEAWLANQKILSTAQDLLLAVCVNCDKGDQADKDLIAQLVKLKPKIKQQQQHYLECMRELIKQSQTNFEIFIQYTVYNELNTQLQHYIQQQQQQQTQQIPRNQHNLFLLQTAFTTDGSLTTQIFAQIMQSILLQKNADDFLRILKVLLRDTIRNSRQDFDLSKFSSELINDTYLTNQPNFNLQPFILTVAGGQADFMMLQVRERFVNGICDLITVCILVAITPLILNKRESLIKYYMTVSKIQSDVISWLQTIMQTLEISPKELVRCILKILFMVEKPEQHYTIDNWPSEQERATLFRVVSEIPVLSETLHLLLMITSNLPEYFYMLLCVEENLLKTAALVHVKDIYSLKLNKPEQFIELLFNICLYKYQNPPTFAFTVFYWRAWQILLLISAIDPKGFGQRVWDQYPMLRLLMEMIMIEDYNFPPQSSITEDMTADKYIAMENQISALEKLEILNFENSFDTNQQVRVVKTEANSKLIGQIMKFDPMGPPRRPTPDTIQNIRKLNSEYKLGQLLCKCRQPDFLLSLIKRQNSALSLPWLSSLIESSSDECLEIMPIQCICEFIWNLLSGATNNGEELNIKKQLNLEQLLYKIKLILTSDDLSDSNIIKQITDTFDYFLNKLCSDKPTVRSGALKIFNKLFFPPSQPADLSQLIVVFTNLSAFDIHLKPLLLKYFRKALMVETDSEYINLYVNFLFEQLLNYYKQQHELETSMQLESLVPELQNDALKQAYNEAAIDFADFFFNRSYCANSIQLIKSTNSPANAQLSQDIRRLRSSFTQFALLLIQLNQYSIDDADDASNDDGKGQNLNIKMLVKSKQEFSRANLQNNSYILIEKSPQCYIYIHEKIYNLIIYFILTIAESYDADSLASNGYKNGNSDDENEQEERENWKNLYESFFPAEAKTGIKYLNCDFKMAVNEQVKLKIFRIDSAKNFRNEYVCQRLEEYLKSSKDPGIGERMIEQLVSSIGTGSKQLFGHLLETFGLSWLSTYLIIKQIEENIRNKKFELNPSDLAQISSGGQMSFKVLGKSIDSLLSRLRQITSGSKYLQEKLSLGKLLEKKLDELHAKFERSKDKPSTSDVEMKDESEAANSLSKRRVLSVFSFDFENKMNLTDENRNLKSLSANDIINQNKKCMSCLEHIQSQIQKVKKAKLDQLRSKESSLKAEQESAMITEDSSTTDDPAEVAQKFQNVKALELYKVIESSTSQELETNLNQKLNEIESPDERVGVIADLIITSENSLKLKLKASTAVSSVRRPKAAKKTPKSLLKQNRCIVDILLDYFCHFDPQIVDKQVDLENRLLFELRDSGAPSESLSSLTTSAITQPFLISLFVHQANWKKLHNCVEYILQDFSFFRDKYRINPTNVLNFLSSLIHIPEFWKGTESKVQQKYDEENVLTLNDRQICRLIDFIVLEIYSTYEPILQAKDNFDLLESLSKNENKGLDFIDIKFKLNRRIQLLKHFIKDYSSGKDALFRKILIHLNDQLARDMVFDELKSGTFDEKDPLNESRERLLAKIQALFLYSLYLEENSIINHITNPHRLFSNLYFKLDIPTKLDVKTHRLLNCFGEIEEIYSKNATSSGIIGVTGPASHYKKQEKQELTALNKKQETFMMDAYSVCVKLASTHPFIFIRQIPMMEGLLQGRVVYSFDEFKRRKFDKLFHYIIDLLNFLVPYVFHLEYLSYLQSIISHYFDVFTSYCNENREALGSLVLKFMDFLEKLINSDIKIGHKMIITKYASFLSVLQKSYPEISSLKYLTSIEVMPFVLDDSGKELQDELLSSSSLTSVNVFNQKFSTSLWSSKQLEPFTNKILNRDNFDGVLTTLNELDSVSMQQPTILSHFVHYLEPLIKDPNDTLRDLALSLILRYLRTNPKEAGSFLPSYSQALSDEDSTSKIFNSVLKIFPEITLLNYDKSHILIKNALKGASKHNLDISKTLSDTIRLLQLEKYVY